MSARGALFALDQNFPQPLVDAAAPYFRGVELSPIWTIDRRLADLEDWEVPLALHHHELPFDVREARVGYVRSPRASDPVIVVAALGSAALSGWGWTDT